MSQQLLPSTAATARDSHSDFEDKADELDHHAVGSSLSTLGQLLWRHRNVGLATVPGIVCVGAACWFTQWLSMQLPECQKWAFNCDLSPSVRFFYRNFGLVQGIVTAIYSIGLAALAFSAHVFSESAFWPLSHQQCFSISQMDTYLEASRGSILSTLPALCMVRTLDSAVVLLLTTFITLTPLAAAPVIGQVYSKVNITVQYQGRLQVGGGINVPYAQSNPPGPTRERSTALYTSWQTRLSDEPLPKYRLWFVDRTLMAERGNFTIGTVGIQQDIQCGGWVAKPNKEWVAGGGQRFMAFNTSMRSSQDKSGFEDQKTRHSGIVRVRDVNKLAVWVHNYTFTNANKTTATLIFAALDGKIEDGQMTNTKHLPDDARTKGISSIACQVTVEMMEATLKVGDAPGPVTPVNSMTNLKVFGQLDPSERNHTRNMNELALWFAVAPVANGAYVYGTQPMYRYIPKWLPERYTENSAGHNYGWTVNYIKRFIRISTGASILGEVGKYAIHQDTEDENAEDVKKAVTVQFPSYVHVMKMDPSKPRLLIVLPLIILGCGTILIIWNVKRHKAMGIPIKSQAPLVEMIKSSQTKDVADAAARPSDLGRQRLRFKKGTDGTWGFYNVT
ncbi:hypothetical protein E8E12_006935 [Didymella heteroderae]|uniref:Uncharacterized protein n=1 Tax=Didymella heteroderae TaxID=1769908 RepID=A0A9P4WYB9_9PLEO|nr:hypothetical protein E8E12_006935 [Didymella heteroderae]